METAKLSYEESSKYREQYIQTFININSERYKDYLYFANGYFLWDCIKLNHEIITPYHLVYDEDHGDVMFFWDHYGYEEILKLGREYIFIAPYEYLIKNLDDYPQDLYIFDPTLTWTIIATHETWSDNNDKLLRIRKEKNFSST